MSKKKWISDNDDAHFDGNPAYKHSRKRIGASGKGHPAVKVTKKKKVTRKRVAAKR